MSRTKKETTQFLVAPNVSEAEDLRIYAADAEKVELMTRTPGYEIIKNNLEEYRLKIGESIAYLNPTTKEYYEARTMYIASDKLLKLIEDYAFNRQRAVEFLKKLDNLNENVILDVDN